MKGTLLVCLDCGLTTKYICGGLYDSPQECPECGSGNIKYWHCDHLSRDEEFYITGEEAAKMSDDEYRLLLGF